MVAEMIQASTVIEAYHGKRLAGNGMKIAKTLVEDDNPVIRIIRPYSVRYQAMHPATIFPDSKPLYHILYLKSASSLFHRS